MKTRLSLFLAGLALLFLAGCASADSSAGSMPDISNYVEIGNKIPQTTMLVGDNPKPIPYNGDQKVAVPPFSGPYMTVTVKIFNEEGKLLRSKVIYIGQTGKVSETPLGYEPLGATWKGGSLKIFPDTQAVPK